MYLLCLFFPTVSVGYEYESCPDLILWEKRTAVLQGYEIDASKLGGWSLDKHHALNIQSGERISRIPGARPWCETCLMCFVRCEAKTQANSTGSRAIHWSEGLIQILLGDLLCTVTAEHRGCRSEGLQGLTLWARQTRLRQFSHRAMEGAVTGRSGEHCGDAEEKPLTQLLGSAGCLFGGNFQTESPGVYSISGVYQAGRTFWAESTVRAKALKPKRGVTGEKDHCALSKG